MPKGRSFVPSTLRDGLWYEHQHCAAPGSLARELHTTSGVMMTGPFSSDSHGYPPAPPEPYTHRNVERNFKTTNRFSEHDNRHSFQDRGIYFGNGKDTRLLGKRLTPTLARQHHSDPDFLTHFGRQVVSYDYGSTYSHTFESRPGTDPAIHRRFPLIYSEPQPEKTLDPGKNPLLVGSTVKQRTPLAVLAVTQEPFLPPNKFKYAYHGLSKCYPSYNPKVGMLPRTHDHKSHSIRY